MLNKNCYFWIDSKIPEEERTMSVMCEQCHEQHPELGWFWDGSKGYGPFEINCDICGAAIHTKEQK